MSVARMARSGRTTQLCAHQCQCELVGEQFIEREPRPERAVRQDVGDFFRLVQAMQRGRKIGEGTAPYHFEADPYRQLRHLRERLRHGAPHRADRKPCGERIDRIDAGEFGKAILIDHAVGMHHLQRAVEHLDGAGEVTHFADRQQLVEITALRAEVGQHDRAGVVAGEHGVGRAGAAGRRCTMPINGDFQGDDRARHSIADVWLRAAGDHGGGQAQQQIDDARRLAAVEQIAEQLVLLRPDAAKARYRREQGVEDIGAHQNPALAFPLDCRFMSLRSKRSNPVFHLYTRIGWDVSSPAMTFGYDSNLREVTDNAASARYINLARHVRAFGVHERQKMSASTRSSDGLDDRRKRLLFRCWHRGTKEMDYILGRFADAHIADLSEEDVADFERLIELPDPDLYNAFNDKLPLDAVYAEGIFRRIKAFTDAGSSA